jgi:hypothetical protein
LRATVGLTSYLLRVGRSPTLFKGVEPTAAKRIHPSEKDRHRRFSARESEIAAAHRSGFAL